jgi:hypothetical protein
MKQQLVIIGELPSPIGGVSIHVMRLSAELASNNYAVTVFNLSSSPDSKMVRQLEKMGVSILNGHKFTFFELLYILFKVIKKNTIVSIHTKHWFILLVLTLIKLIKKNVKLVLTIHSLREEFKKMRFILKSALIVSFKSMNKLLVTNNDIKNKLILLGVNANKVFISKTFLPPAEFEYFEMSEKTSLFVVGKFPVISANASKLQFYNNEDLYGFDLCIQLVYKLKVAGYNPALLFSLPEIGEHDYYNEKIKEISALNIQDNIMVRTGSHSFIPILSMSDIFIRPTNTDGDSISIREAISINKPTLTSDAVQRPDEVVLFCNRDVNDLFLKTIALCENISNNNHQELKESNDNGKRLSKIKKEREVIDFIVS